MVKRIFFLFFLCVLIFTFLNKALAVVYSANTPISHGSTVNATVGGEAFSLPAQVATAQNITKEVKKKFPIDLALLLLIGLIFLVAIGILLYKLRFRLWVIFIDFLRRRKKMHHDWFLDYWQ